MAEEVWDEIRDAEDGRHELHLIGDEVTNRLEKSNGQLPSGLYKLISLNYLEISDTKLSAISKDVGALKSLLNLALHRNELVEIPDTINQLEKLKFLDLSFNKLTSLPDTLLLPCVQTLNFSNNELSTLPDFSGFTCLNILYTEHNNLTEFPYGLYKLTGFSELNVSNNQITSVPGDVKDMQTLKNLDLSNNSLGTVCGELIDCRKLKNLDLRNNPLKDNRLKKMTNQCSTKAILEYIAKQSKGGGGGGKKKGKGKKGHVESEEKDEITRKIFILQSKEDERRVVTTESVKEERPYICCTVVKQLDLADPAFFKSFISLQTKLHENECDMRTRATIATHTLSDLKFPLKYEAISPTDLQIVALGKTKKCVAGKLIADLKNEREALKLKKKRQVKTGLYKFIDLVDGKELLACIKNSDGDVISFPPITNSEMTKIHSSVADVFIEVTSPTSLPQCKFVMEEIIRQMYHLGFSSVVDEMEGIVLEQMRVCDEKGDLRVVYPSKIDLDLKGIPVERVDCKTE
ncbi:leucine-rich repeat-containing protein 47-like [Hydractinia symbiolongicarpus]|uniref:leucine-rich repeat-containing protein 47-like n=1 Tax=Hydractinia symbiolongicarpus TaxID=13093 RepID=UPI00254E5A90|nr:leucine-rich repeat-containing protein 47-like [Hydractinia symbiolongicarpus]